jgi:putative GTP pyrophosphokinase
MTETGSTFDFAAHRRASEAEYHRVRPLYVDFASEVEAILTECLRALPLAVASVQARAKDVDSFGEKAASLHELDPSQPRYPRPLADITDLAAARVITFFPKSVAVVDALLHKEFVVLERTDKADLLREQEKLGYQSVHYLVRLSPSRTVLAEYGRYRDLVAEIQVRTVLQHAWAEIEHDIQYKSVETIPLTIRRRFMAVAGLLEIADREFQEIQDEDERLRQAARLSVNAGRLEEVEITGDALKAYLDKRMGSDGRMTRSAYEHEARVLRSLGFNTFGALDECIAGLDDDRISRELWGTRQGQLTRLEHVLLAAMGDEYVRRHDWRDLDWFQATRNDVIDRLRSRGLFKGDRSPAPRRRLTIREALGLTPDIRAPAV